MDVQIPYKPREWAKPFHETFKRYIALVLHRRAGKTTALVNHAQRSAMDVVREKERIQYLAPNLTKAELDSLFSQKRIYGVVLPTYRQAKYVAWDMLKYFSSPIPGTIPNESELLMNYPNGAKVGLFGADNPDALRGIPFWGLAFDEFSQQPANIFSEVLSKSLADHLGYAIFSGTIKGKNQLFRTYEAAKNNPNEWFSLWQDIDESLKKEKGATIKLLEIALGDDRKLIQQGLMTQEEFDQEWYLSPEAAIKGAYYAKEIAEARKNKRIGIVPYDTALRVHDVWDLGKGPKMAVGLFQNFGGQIHLIDFIQGEDSDGIPQMIAKLQRLPYVFGKHFAPHDIRSTDLSTGKTRQQLAESLNWKFEIVPELSVDDGIQQAKLFFSRLWIDEQNCSYFLDAIGNYHQEWEENRGMFKETPYHDWSSHAADVLRYASLVKDKMTNESDFAPLYFYEPKSNPGR